MTCRAVRFTHTVPGAKSGKRDGGIRGRGMNPRLCPRVPTASDTHPPAPTPSRLERRTGRKSRPVSRSRCPRSRRLQPLGHLTVESFPTTCGDPPDPIRAASESTIVYRRTPLSSTSALKAATVLARVESPCPGSRIGAHEVTAAIGAGGMGEVHRPRPEGIGLVEFRRRAHATLTTSSKSRVILLSPFACRMYVR
jgi:hypothetical protein